MIDVNAESLLTLTQVCNRIPGKNGRRLHYQTVLAWTAKGKQGVRLESVLIGRTRYTSEQALQRFADRLNPKETSRPRPGKRNQVDEDREYITVRWGI